jgi:chromate transporter
VLGKRAIHDLATLLIFAVTLGLLLRFKKVQEPLVIVAAGAVGFLIKGGLWH